MRVPMMDLAAEYRSIKEEVDGAVAEFLDSGEYILGRYVEGFEAAFAKYLGVKHSVGVASGTDALLVALRALGVGETDEVITTPFTFVASADVIVRLGARPVFVDVEPDTLNINAKLANAALTERTAVVLPVHLYGMPCDIADLTAVGSPGVRVVEDAAQALGSRYEGRQVGTFGTAGCFSFFPTKNLGGYGDGGIIVTNDDDVAAGARVLRVHGAPRKNYPEIIGYKSRLDAMQAAVLIVKLKRLDGWIARKRELVRLYRERLSEVEGIRLLAEPPAREPAYHQFTIRAGKRDELARFLGERGIGSGTYYPIPVHLTPAFKFLGYRPGDFPEAERAAREVLSLPLFSQMTDDQLDAVCSAVEEFYRG